MPTAVTQPEALLHAVLVEFTWAEHQMALLALRLRLMFQVAARRPSDKLTKTFTGTKSSSAASSSLHVSHHGGSTTRFATFKLPVTAYAAPGECQPGT